MIETQVTQMMKNMIDQLICIENKFDDRVDNDDVICMENGLNKVVKISEKV